MYDNESLPSDILDICKDSVPDKSLKRYVNAYDVFMKWQKSNGTNSLAEPVFLNYFNEMSKTYKPSSMWSMYSMLRSTILCNHNVNISEYRRLIDFLKKQAAGFQSKKSNIFTAEDVNKFLMEAPEYRYLAMKAVLVFGVIGAVRLAEMADVKTDYVQDNVNEIIVRIPDSNTKIPKAYIIDGLFAEIVRKYMRTRSDKSPTDRFFMQYRDGKCTNQVIGKNTIAKMPKEIAKYLQLPDFNNYTGHSFRRTSATILADTRGYKRTFGNYYTGQKQNDPLSGSSVNVKEEMIDESFSIIELPSEAELSHHYENDSLSEFSMTAKEEPMEDPFTSTIGRNSEGIKLMSSEVSRTLKDAAKYGVDVCLLIQLWSEFDEKLVSAMDDGTRSLVSSRNSDSSSESNYSMKSSSSSGAVKKSVKYAAASAVRVIRKAERRTPSCRKRLLAICSQFKATLIQLMDTVALPASGQSYVSQDTSDNSDTQTATNRLTSTNSQGLNIETKGRKVVVLSTGDFDRPSHVTEQSNFGIDTSATTHTTQSVNNLLPSSSSQAMSKTCKRDGNGEILETRNIVTPPLQAGGHTSIAQHTTPVTATHQSISNSTSHNIMNTANYPTENVGHPNPVNSFFPPDYSYA